MDQATLVNFDVEKGQRVVDALDREGFSPNVALLASLPQYETWRLVISSNSIAGYEDLFAHLRNAGVQAADRPTIFLRGMEEPFIRELREIFSGANDTYGMRLGGQKFGDQYIEDAFVYRIR